MSDAPKTAAGQRTNQRTEHANSGRALLVAKIEKAEAIENLDEIIEETDGVMVARGDLGVETSVELVPVYQKRIIEKAVANDKFVITATQMLQSMIENAAPDACRGIGRGKCRLGRERCGDAFGGNSIWVSTRSRRSGRWPGSSTSAETVKPAELQKTGKILASANGQDKPGAMQGGGLCGEGNDDRKGRGVYGIRFNGEAGFRAFRSGLQTFALTTSEDVKNQLP